MEIKKKKKKRGNQLNRRTITPLSLSENRNMYAYMMLIYPEISKTQNVTHRVTYKRCTEKSRKLASKGILICDRISL